MGALPVLVDSGTGRTARKHAYDLAGNNTDAYENAIHKNVGPATLHVLDCSSF